MRTLSVFVLLAISPSTVCLGDEADPYGAKGPCAYLFELPGGKCLDGVFTLETEIGPGQKIVTSKVTASSETPKSSGSVAPVAECVANHMAFYARWYIKHLDTPGKETNTIHVVNANTCK
jgi:hypothetical protein